jgi:serine O-acetyltransferase
MDRAIASRSAIVSRMWNRLFRKRTKRQRPSSTEAAYVPTPEESASLERYFRETPEGRAELTRYLRESPDGRARMEQHFKATPQGRASLEEHFRTTPEERACLEHHIRAKPGGEAELREAIADEIRRQQPTLLETLRGDTAAYASLMLKPLQFKTGLELLRETARLSWENDAFFSLLLYRVRVRLYVRGVPVLPTLLHRLCVLLGQIDIGKHVLIEPGVYIPHGKVVIDGIVRIGRGTMITPWVTLGLTTAIEGPSIGRNVLIGTGAKILGPLEIGERARIAANAVVLTDVPPDTTVAGAPAKVVRDRRS